MYLHILQWTWNSIDHNWLLAIISWVFFPFCIFSFACMCVTISAVTQYFLNIISWDRMTCIYLPKCFDCFLIYLKKISILITRTFIDWMVHLFKVHINTLTHPACECMYTAASHENINVNSFHASMVSFNRSSIKNSHLIPDSNQQEKLTDWIPIVFDIELSEYVGAKNFIKQLREIDCWC